MVRIEIDNRGLEAPEPRVRILTTLSGMSSAEELVALMDREPMMLYPELERRGYTWEFAASDDHYVLTVRHAAA